MILLLITGILFFLYSILLLSLWRWWSKAPEYPSARHVTAQKLTVVIPARNEEKTIGSLLGALQLQTYPASLLEIIVVNDHSTDGTAAVVSTFPGVRLLHLEEECLNSYKKKALAAGIAAAGGEIIISTDADCLPPAGWVQSIVSVMQQRNAAFLAAPVRLIYTNRLAGIFQATDFLMLQAITGAVVYANKLTMCNGANLAYTKKAYTAAGGFSGIDHIASGDDLLLMYKIWKMYPGAVQYLKSNDAIVQTAAAPTWKDFFQQRIRWASKARQYADKRFLPILILVYLFNLSFLILAVLAVADPQYVLWLLSLWLLKAAVEAPLFFSAAKFFEAPKLMKWLFILQPLHILYTVVIGFMGQQGRYKWKGRRVR